MHKLGSVVAMWVLTLLLRRCAGFDIPLYHVISNSVYRSNYIPPMTPCLWLKHISHIHINYCIDIRHYFTTVYALVNSQFAKITRQINELNGSYFHHVIFIIFNTLWL